MATSAILEHPVSPARAGVLDESVSWLDSVVNGNFAETGAPERGTAGVRAAVALRREQLDAAEELVRRRYAWRGYGLAWESRAAAAPLVTLLAQSGRSLLGTLTVRPTGATPLFAEHSYGGEIEQLRAAGRRVGEVIRLAIEEGADWRSAMNTLVRAGYAVMRFMHGLTDAVIEVNPRHARFYQRAYGFVTAGAERFCVRVGAPSVLMLVELEALGKRLESLGI